MSNELDVAWAAGLLEGEGCFSLHKRSDRASTYNRAIHCEMTDKDVIDKLYSVFNVGTVVPRLNMKGRRDPRIRKPTYIWSVQNKDGIKEVLEKILPYMGTRRSEKIKLLLENLNENSKAVS